MSKLKSKKTLLVLVLFSKDFGNLGIDWLAQKKKKNLGIDCRIYRYL